MKKRINFSIALLACLLLLTACSSPDNKSDSVQNTINQPAKEGAYVIETSKEGLLVVNAKSDNFGATGGEEEFYGAIKYTYPNASKEVKVGQRVVIESDGPIMESYPGQGAAKSIKVLPEYQPDKANLSESQVVKQVLETATSKSTRVPAIREINYDEKKDSWKVSVKQEEDTYEVNVKDQ